MKSNNILLILGLICLIFFCVYYSNNYNESLETKTYNDYHIVCSKYNKNVDFLNEINIPYTIIDKNTVPNKANEATSYLHYIINNYEKLPNNIIFIHDENESWHHDGKITDNIYNWINEYEKNGKLYYEFNNQVINKDDPIKNGLNVAYNDFWDKCIKPKVGNVNDAIPESGKCCAQFIVSKSQILINTKEFYNVMYNWLINNTNGEGNGNPDDIYSGHNTSRYAEWSWRFIFSPENNK